MTSVVLKRDRNYGARILKNQNIWSLVLKPRSLWPLNGIVGQLLKLEFNQCLKVFHCVVKFLSFHSWIKQGNNTHNFFWMSVIKFLRKLQKKKKKKKKDWVSQIFANDFLNIVPSLFHLRSLNVILIAISELLLDGCVKKR